MGKRRVLTNPTTIRCNKKTKNRYKDYGKYGETMDGILNRVMDRMEELEK